MTYVVNESCIRCKTMDCVEVCPVDCFYEGGMEVGDLPGRKCQPHQAVIGLFRHYRGGQAGGQRGPQGPVE